MSKEIIDEILAITREIEDQLKFYREIGLEDIGHSAGATELAPTANSTDVSTSPASPGITRLSSAFTCVLYRSRIPIRRLATGY